MSQRILAIDAALTVGWAHTESPGGTWSNPGEGYGERFAYFGGWLQDLLVAYPSDLIVYEMAHHRGGPPTRLGVGWQTLIEYMAKINGCAVRSCHTATLKKHATGSGKATKAEMIAAGIARGWQDDEYDDNHADALWLLDWALTN